MVGKTYKYIKYPYAYFAAQVEFACAIARVSRKSRLHAFKRYTDIYGSLTDHHYADNGNYNWVLEVLAKFERLIEEFKDPEELSSKIYNLYLSTPSIYENVLDLSRIEPLRFGCFRLNRSNFYLSKNQVRLHFSPMRKGLLTTKLGMQASDLSPAYIQDRKKDFSDMINYIYAHPEEFPGVTHFVSSTWMQNMSVYRSFFPDTENVVKRTEHDTYFWIWGQFTKWDYSSNLSRLDSFRASLNESTTLKQVLDSIPMKVIEVLVPLQDMFEKYVPGYTSERVYELISSSLEFDTSRLLRGHTAYQSEE